MTISYRPEIDGLRAVAVLSVILFHAGLGPFGGGFIGVDIFFVISGFLISSILMREIEAGRFSLVDFYERRARRILPALYVMLLATIPFAIWLMLPYQLIDYGEAAVATLLFVSNILYIFESSYFAEGSSLNPLLHTWSLGVEEQFYLGFPIALLVIARFAPTRLRRRLVVLAILAGTVVSFAGALALLELSSTAAFFFSPTRFWEMLLGALAALGPGAMAEAKSSRLLRRATTILDGLGLRPARMSHEAAALLGLMLVLVSIFALDETYPYPGAWTLAACLGAALFLVFATRETLAGRILGARPLVAIGLVSYSAYLWHQPLFSFTELHLGAAPGIGLATFLILATFVLAGLSWAYVERPFRDRRRIGARAIFLGGAGGAAALASVGVILVLQAGFVSRYPPAARDLALLDPLAEGRFVRAAFDRMEGAAFDTDPTTPNILIVGDSYAEDFANLALEGGFLRRASLSAHHIPAPCGVVWREGGHEALIDAADRAYCRRSGRLSEIKDRLREADTVILAASWRPWVVETIPETVVRIREVTPARLVVIGRKSFGPVQVRNYIKMDPETRVALRNPVDPMVAEINARMRETVDKDIFVDFIGRACDPSGCPVFTPEGRLISFDGWHLTRAGAIALAPKLFSDPLLATAGGIASASSADGSATKAAWRR